MKEIYQQFHRLYNIDIIKEKYINRTCLNYMRGINFPSAKHGRLSQLIVVSQ